MKKIMKKIRPILFLATLFLLVFNLQGSTEINRLNWVEVSSKRFAPQIMFDFSRSLYFEKSINKEKMQLELAFPGMTLKSFQKQKVEEKIRKLKDVVSSVELLYKEIPSPRVVLIITFATKDILVKWNKLEADSHRLILDIFSKKLLKKLNNKGATILYAQNDIIKNNLYKQNLLMGSSYYNVKKKFRILIDAGHGGLDSGSRGFFLLKEKDIALDIARRTKLLLSNNGFNVFLTRNGDEGLTLLQRSELASQLRADLFVSIHVNAAQGIEAINGVETYCQDKKGLLAPTRRGGFLFVLSNNEMELVQKADTLLSNNIDLSNKLASKIQHSVLGVLEKKGLFVNNKGVKKENFRIILRSEIPVALIEVGFLTNKQEAKRLVSSAYRQILAEGICEGIKDYILSLR